MAELVLSALLPVLFEKLTSAALSSIARYKRIDVEIKKWPRALKDIQDVLIDASEKEIANHSVKRWLNDLQHLAYDIDDVLDDLSYQAMDREFNRDSEAITITNKVRKLIPSCCTNFSRSTRMLAKVDDITARLQDLLEKKDGLRLEVKEETRPRNHYIINRKYESSVFDPSGIVGRKAEKEELVQQLLMDGPSHQNFSVVPIVGMGGVGKTTLARLLYADKQVNDHFKLKVWVCVSGEFDVFGISKGIFKGVAPEVKEELSDFNLLQEALRDHLRGQRFLLVLDDVWSKNYNDWKKLVEPFYTCAPGSKIIITTRKDELLKQLVSTPLNKRLERLSNEDAMSLIARNALEVDNFDSHLSLKPYAEGIVRKCGGLPLALITLGRLLRTKGDDAEHWKYVLSSEIWSLKDGGDILPALRLSYHELSAPLKQLFAYCSLFPKDFLFDKDELVLLWVAEGFLHQSTPSNLTKEQLGHDYFDELLSRSFFQLAPEGKSLFVMHDLLNDLATYVAGEFFVRLDDQTQNNVGNEMLEKYRHMSFVREEYTPYKKFEALKRAKSLRTFLATSVWVDKSWQSFYLSSKVLADLLPDLQLLRVLNLSRFEITEVPESIGTLRHLRYLNLSRTRITHLPESLCNLYKLQTLILFGCKELIKLPNSFFKLKNLRHLDLQYTSLVKMPLRIGEVKSLQTLSLIIIGGKSGIDISKLKDFKNLCGKVSIKGLDNVETAAHARDAQLSLKRFSELELVWSVNLHGSQNEMLQKDVLNELKPWDGYLKRLRIVSYGGLEFPNWIGDSSFINLEHVLIKSCTRCTSLPQLGQLRFLKELYIESLSEVEVVGLEFFGTGGTFRSLEILSFKDMHGWKKWSANITEAFPRLKQLFIEVCPELVELSLGALNSLIALTVSKCDICVLRRLVEVASSITKLEIEGISGLNDIAWRGIIEYVRAVEKLSIVSCNELSYLWEPGVAASKVLVKLRKLTVMNCNNLVSLGEGDVKDNCPESIETLIVRHCESITSISLPMGGQKLKSLDIFDCEGPLETEWGGQKMNNNNRSENVSILETVSIFKWPNLKSIIELSYLVHLTSLKIVNCKNLESFPDNELPNLTSLKHLEIKDCPSMDDCFPRGFWPPNLRSLEIGMLKKPISEWGLQNFPTTMVALHLYGGGEDGVTSYSQISQLFPSSLTVLRISNFKKLESLNSIGLPPHLQRLKIFNCQNLNKLVIHPQHPTSLQHLSFWDCPNMIDIPQVLLPSLLSLEILLDCPNLKARYNIRGTFRPLISHIPCIDIFPEE